jgi:RND superfamily putative drug exporter
MHRLTRSIGVASARHPLRTLAAWAVLAVAVLALATTSGGRFADDLVAPGSESDLAMQLLEERFPEASDGTAMLVFAADPGERLDARRAAIEATVTRAERVPHVTSVADLFTTAAGSAVSPDGRVGFAAVTFDRPAFDVGPDPFVALERALEPARADGLTAELGGDSVFLNGESEQSGAEALGLLVALVVLLVAFGTVVAALVPIGLALVAVATGVGGIVLLANATEVSTVAPGVAAMVGLGVGIDYALIVMARYREQRAAGQDTREAIASAMESSGSSVVFAGGTVVVAMLALVLTGIGVLASMGLATSLVVLVAVAAATTLLPAVLALLGDRLERGRLPHVRRRGTPAPEDTVWWQFGHRVARRPWPFLVASVVLMLGLAAPALGMNLAFPDAGDEPTSTTHRRGYDLLAAGFGPGVNGPLLVVADLDAPGVGADDLPRIAGRIAAEPGVASVGEPVTNDATDAAVLSLVPTTGPSDRATSATIDRLRSLLPAGVHVTGITAMTDDLNGQLTDTLPLFVGAVLLASIMLLMLVFRSVVVPLKAAAMNLLSIGAAYGVLVAVFQWGWLQELVGLQATTPIPSPIPVVMFAIVFGMSMDYEVFLLSRIREEYLRTGDNSESVARGLASTGRVITSAALIMVAVFAGFVADPSPSVKMLGLGLAVAVALDATVVRMVIVPSSMALLGRANWWLPRWLDRSLPRVGGAGHTSPAPVTAPDDSRQPVTATVS